MTDTVLAFDKQGRSIDSNGHLFVPESNLTKATVNGYLGSEIPQGASLGLKPGQIYQVFRDPAELQKAASTFNGKPLLMLHKSSTADNHPKESTVGAVGTDVKWKAPYLVGSLSIWDGTAIAGIETREQHELSCSYAYDPVLEAGEYEGKPYEIRMKNIRGNHVAIVEQGRAGPDCLVGDSALNLKDKKPMPILKKAAYNAAAAGFTAQAALYASDAAMKPVHTKFLKLAADAKACADKAKDEEEMDAEDEMDMEDKKAKDVDPDLDDEDDGGKKKEQTSDKKARDKRAKDKMAKDKAAKDKRAKDESEEDEDEDEEDDKKAKDKRAMDAAISAATTSVRTQMRAIAEAEKAVRPYVGELVMAFDSAGDVYKFALDRLGVDTKGVDSSAFATILKYAGKPATGAAPVRHANDSAGPSPFAAAALKSRG